MKLAVGILQCIVTLCSKQSIQWCAHMPIPILAVSM